MPPPKGCVSSELQIVCETKQVWIIVLAACHKLINAVPMRKVEDEVYWNGMDTTHPPVVASCICTSAATYSHRGSSLDLTSKVL
jgi:hypothetical protein